MSADVACPHGHTEGRNKHGQCLRCRTLYERLKGAKPAYLRAVGLTWIGQAQRGLRRRRKRGETCATKRQLLALWYSQNGKCALTGMLIDGAPHLDHRVPVTLGGAHTVDNLQWVHPMANQAKQHRSVEEFRSWLLTAGDALRQKMKLEELL